MSFSSRATDARADVGGVGAADLLLADDLRVAQPATRVDAQ
jgi:hypothetical protein